MARIVGLNAIILYANDAAALARWYEKTLGLATLENADDGNFYGEIDDLHSGFTFQFAIYPAKQQLAPGARGLMVNYRVDDFDAFVAHLERSGEKVERSREDYGRFARLRDPEGNPVEIWAPFDPSPLDLSLSHHDHEAGR
jgi:catechol 2,3-dioxygenase-like lactoylglutathione lyase family enzyme